MLVDLCIIVLLVVSVVRGRQIGFVRQLGSTIGFVAGLLLGAWIEPHTVSLVHTPAGRAFVTIVTTLGCALILLTVGETLGILVKRRLLHHRLNRYDNVLGSGLSAVSLLASAWLMAAILVTLPVSGVETAVRSSHIVRTLNQHLPPAPTVIADLGQLIDPNGFPQVFIGSEPIPRGDVHLPALGQLEPAVNKDKLSVVKIEGQGCGGIVEGSGFVVGKNFVATNAHVVAGINQPFVQDANGSHHGTVVWFDPDLDLAILRVSDLAGSPLQINTATAPSGTAAAALGYPGGGGFTAGPAAVLDEFQASGRNIYGQKQTLRSVYEVRADIIPGNSGGPLINQSGQVIGVVFAESTSYAHTGYALTMAAVQRAIHQAVAANQATGTGRCAD
jgi:S1-C subfamily serine protease